MLRPRRLTMAAIAFCTVLLAGSAGAQSSRPIRESTPGLRHEVRISADSARATALARVKGGVIKDEEIEREGGRLVYSFDIKTAGRAGIDEVLVDASTGAVLSVKHESPADEAAEMAKDRAAKDKAARDQAAKPATKKPTATEKERMVGEGALRRAE